jgi:hypothetical protein
VQLVALIQLLASIKKMRLATLLLGLLAISFSCFGQLDETYFLLGAQFDKGGRTVLKNHPTTSGLIIDFHQDEIGQIRRIEEISGQDFERRETQLNCTNCHEFYELHSIKLSEILNSFYSVSRWSEDEDGNRIDKGIIKCKKIETATIDQKISFLAGQFLVAGTQDNDRYKISLYNSPERFDCLCELLQDLECKIITKEFHYLIPNVHHVYFEPSKRIKDILDNEIEKRNTLANIE